MLGNFSFSLASYESRRPSSLADAQWLSTFKPATGLWFSGSHGFLEEEKEKRSREETSLWYNRRFGENSDVRTITPRVEYGTARAPYPQSAATSERQIALVTLYSAMNNDPRHLRSHRLLQRASTLRRGFDPVESRLCATGRPPAVLYTRTKDIASLLRAVILSISYHVKGIAAFYNLRSRLGSL